MIHQRFKAVINNEEKEIGLLGENHFYKPEDWNFFKETVEEYECIGIEKYTSQPISELILLPTRLILSSRLIKYQKDSGRNLYPIEEYVESARKKVIRLDTYLGVPQMITLPIYLLVLMSKGNKLNLTKKEREEFLCRGEYPPEVTEFMKWQFDVKKRDRNMVKGARKYLANGGNDIMIVCGEYHVPGIRRNLEEMFEDLTLLQTTRS